MQLPTPSPAMRGASSTPSGQRQQGSVVISALLVVSVLAITLIGTELGYLFYQKRNLQNAADLAALTGARQLALTHCTDAAAAVRTNATENLRTLVGPRTVTPQCGHWVAPASTAAETVDGFTEAATDPIAVKVTISATPTLLLPNLPGNRPRTVSVSAVANLDRPLASFSVGSSLVNLEWNSSASLLGALVKGIGLNLDATSLVSYNGLANLKVTPAGLLDRLGITVDTSMGIGQLNALLAGQLQVRPLIDVINATISLADPQGLLGIDASVLVDAIKLKSKLSSLNVTLGSLASSPTGLFAQIVAPGSTANSALNVDVNALDLVYAAIGVATKNHALETGLNIDLLSLVKVTTQVAVVEPPSIAIGGVGSKAYTAQVRTYIHVKTDSGLLGTLLAPLVKLDLPIVLDVVTARGELTKMCTPDLRLGGQDRARIAVTGSILKACVGRIDDTLLFSKAQVCESDLKDMELLNVLGLLRLPANSLQLNGLQMTPVSFDLAQGERARTAVNPLPVGTLVSDLLAQISGLLFGAKPATQAPTTTQVNNLVTEIWNETASVCTQDTSACRGQRYAKAKKLIETNTAQSGLLTGVLTGLGDLLNGVANQCTGLLGIGGSATGCTNMIRDAVTASTAAGSNGAISNALSYLAGVLRPVLDLAGSTVLTPLLRDILGIKLGMVDVHLETLSCHAEPTLVH